MQENFHQVSSYKVDSQYEGVRLDNCLISRLKGLPRTKIYSIIRKGEVRVNKSRQKPSYRLKLDDIIRIPPYTTKLKASKQSTEKHRDRIPCEISVTLHLGGDSSWPIWIETPEKKRVDVDLDIGDAMIYLGCNAYHGRDEYKGTEDYIQVFMHFIRMKYMGLDRPELYPAGMFRVYQ